MREIRVTPIKVSHPYAWLWEPLEDEATFILRSMFGAKAVYLDGKMVLCFSKGEEPWRGMLICMERDQHAALLADFPSLTPHKVLPKWLYLAEARDDFETVAEKIVRLTLRRDPRIGIIPKAKKKINR
ncbi:MAG: hypothetical protein ABIP97_02495 [Chthoniobacterales bacterium]